MFFDSGLAYNDAFNFVDSVSSVVEYKYDNNGNLTEDLNKRIAKIQYNLLYLPDTIQFKNGNRIINRYAADGSKLRTDYFTLVTPLAVPLSKGEVSKLTYQIDIINQDTRMFTENFEYGYYRDTDPDTHKDYACLKRINNSEGYAHFGINPKVDYYYNRKDHLGDNSEVWRAYDKTVLSIWTTVG